MDLRLTTAIFAGKIIAFVTQLKGGGATAAPGLYGLKIDKDLIKKLSRQTGFASIVISGTNGKTTCARLISHLLPPKYKVVHNRQGSNLLRGIASTLIKETTLTGRQKNDIAIWEVDEATLGEALENIKPKIVILLNLFRDQLDRYGEVDSVRHKWQRALKSLPLDTILILNADDPGISILKDSFGGKTVFFGVNSKKIGLVDITHAVDISHCLKCGARLQYSARFGAHLGHYVCPKCDFSRPNAYVFASDLKFEPNFSTFLKLTIDGKQLTINYPMPGLYNIYNLLAAVSALDALKIQVRTIDRDIGSFIPVFGRFQKIKIDKKELIIFLIKNPAGANEVIRTIAELPNLNILAVLNDKIADGKDVSWIWDTNWELLSSKVKNLFVSGIRAYDLALRLKYAGFKLDKKNIHEDISYSISNSIKKLGNKDILLILPTYTALLEVQQSLAKRGGTKWYKN